MVGRGRRARYKPYNLKQDKLIPLSYFEYALKKIVEQGLTVFAGRYRNEEAGRLAYDPKMLFKTPLA